MSQSDSYDVRVQAYLAALTDAQLEGGRSALQLAVQYDIPAAEAQQLATLVNRVDAAFEDVAPTAQFRATLRSDLIGEADAAGMFGQVRSLPPRIQIAAGVALIAAMTLLGRRRLAGEMQNLLQQWREAQPTESAGEVVTQ